MDAFPKQYLPCHTVRLLKQFLTYGSSFQMVSTKTADTSHEILPTRQKCTKMCVRYILNPPPSGQRTQIPGRPVQNRTPSNPILDAPVWNLGQNT